MNLREAAQQALEQLKINRTNFRKGPSKSISKMLAGGNDEAIADLEAALAEPVQEPDPGAYHGWVMREVLFDNGEPVGHREPPQRSSAEPVQEPIECEPQYANEDGWCDWVCPKPQGYLMQCCDCGLIHEVESRVAKYEPRPSESFEVVGNPDFQVQWRMKRRDDISPKQQKQEPVAWYFEARHIDSAWAAAVTLKHPGAEGVYMRNVKPLYTAPPQRKPPCATQECMPSQCPNCASLQDQNAELDRKLAEMEAKLLELQAAVLQSQGIRSGDA